MPEYLPRVPIDPMTSEAMICRVLDDGLVVYSVGENGRDDGGEGHGLPRSDAAVQAGKDDTGFKVWR